MRRKGITRCSMLGLLFVVGVLFLANGFAIAHIDPPGSGSTGIGVSLTLYRNDGTTRVLPGTVTECETIFVRATLGRGPDSADAAFDSINMLLV